MNEYLISNSFLMRRRIDLSMLQGGFHIPKGFHTLVYAALGHELRHVGDSLKRLYDYRCQVTGERIGEAYGNECIVEAHHIEYFTQSLNNDTQNIIILSPTFHRIVHHYNPRFNRQTLCFEFANGVREGLKLDRHLKLK